MYKYIDININININIHTYKQWCKMSATFFEVIFIEHCDDRACAHFTALIGPPLAFLILRKRSGKESMRLCKKDKSTSSHT